MVKSIGSGSLKIIRARKCPTRIEGIKFGPPDLELVL